MNTRVSSAGAAAEEEKQVLPLPNPQSGVSAPSSGRATHCPRLTIKYNLFILNYSLGHKLYFQSPNASIKSGGLIFQSYV